LVIAVSATLYYTEVKAERKILTSRENYNIVQQQEIIKTTFKSIVSDLMVVASHHEMPQILEDHENVDFTPLAKEFLAFSRFKLTYDQVRFLNHLGMEMVRVNLNNGDPVIVPEEHLQLKRNRYYFRDIFQLEEGYVFVSPFDLNIERGEVERPLKPIIRFGLPVFNSNGEKSGVVILNYLGEKLIDALEMMSANTPGRIMLLNSEGFWMKGLRAEDEWGFMFKKRHDRTFKNFFPGAWQKISGTESGQFVNEKGMFTFATVYPLFENMRSTTGSAEPFKSSERYLDNKEYFWKIISYISPEDLKAWPRDFMKRLLWVDAVLLAILGSVSWLLTQAIIRRRQAEEKLAFESRLNEAAANLSEMLLGTHSIEYFSNVLLEKARSLTGSRFGFVGYVDKQTGDFVAVSITRDVYEKCQVSGKELVFHKPGGLLGWSLKTKGAVLTNSPATDQRAGGIPKGHLPINRFISAPAMIEGELIGQLALANSDRDYTEYDLKVVEHLASLYALADQQQKAEERITRLAHYDQLTGLVNRHLFNDRIRQILNLAKRHQKKAALLFIDLDHFKPINDRLGHEAGDAVLKEVARRLLESVRTSDTVARIGGDEFVVVLQDIERCQDAGLSAQKIIKSLSRPIYVGKNKCVIGASIGISIYPSDGEDIDILQKKADEAMYKVKESRKNDYGFYSTEG
jgi:diguanylate cyclase (GGDEF)-like protein